ncbi:MULTISPECIES: ABC transporter permease [unclassified Butyrivibrio]|uniref:ABC transporter permease n=1 Tax=Butyrivibrio sp. LC3010 TaxID=1280680 RepID=UPI000400FCF4|nr:MULTISPECIES: ABC transporter permease [unclassified Butyrivibrio]
MRKIGTNILNFIKNLKLRQIIYLLVMVVLGLIIFGIDVYHDRTVDKQYDQLEGRRWSDDTRCGQVSMFFSENEGVNVDKINEYVYNINKGLIADGLQEADASTQAGNAVWDYCFSSVGSVDTVKDLKTVTAVAIGVGGNYFQFHPMRLVSGNYFPADTVMKDYVILDEDLAWQLFGSDNIVGMDILIGGVPHYIAGVVKRDSGKYVKAAGMVYPTIFMSFESLATYGKIDASVLSTNGTLGVSSVAKKSDDENGNGTSDVDTNAKGVICMEVVMPNMVNNYAKNFVIDKLSLNTTQVDVVDNSARFDNRNLFNLIGKFNTRGMQIKPVIYPYWENNARAYENIFAVLLLIQIVCAVIIFIMIAIIVVQAYRHRKWTVGQLVQKLADWKYDLESNMKYHNQKWKYF